LFIDRLRSLLERENIRKLAKEAGFVKRSSPLTAEAFMKLLLRNHSPHRILYSPIRPITFVVKKRWEGQTNADYIQRKD
jgi:hypothetical protein